MSSDWQTGKQLVWLLANRAWPEGDRRLVFATVLLCTPEEVRFLPITAGYPMALVMIGDVQPDGSEPGVGTLNIDVLVIQHGESRDLESSALAGGIRTGGAGRSEGRGLLEVWEEAQNAAARLTGSDGLPATAAYVGAPAAARGEGAESAVARRMTVRCTTTPGRSYEAPRFLKLTALGGGSLKAEWYLPADRWDRRRVIVRYAAGAVAPATAVAGTDVVVLPGAVDVTWSPVGGPGTFSVAIFEAYDETGSDTDERFSSQNPDTYGTKAVT